MKFLVDQGGKGRKFNRGVSDIFFLCVDIFPIKGSNQYWRKIIWPASSSKQWWRSQILSPCSSRATYSWLPRTISGQIFIVSKDEHQNPWATCAWSPSQWKTVFWCSEGNSCVCFSLSIISVAQNSLQHAHVSLTEKHRTKCSAPGVASPGLSREAASSPSTCWQY